MAQAEPQTPSFSVAIAAFNAAEWIVPTVRSALDQTYPASEIIVIGDGCTDRTGEVLAANFGSAVRWVNLDRNSGGQSVPNNEAIARSRGTHVAYLGHDDIWSPRHLERVAEIVRAGNPDFAVSGAVYHGPAGSRFYQITGLFDDPRVAAEEFFPPSSFAHRRDVVDRIGSWREPDLLREPADCEFLLRAVARGCSFASTKTITVHKFAAGHRYLSYRYRSGVEQQRMLERLSSEEGEAQLLREIEADIAAGADHPPVRYLDFRAFDRGELYRRNRSAKGLDAGAPIRVDAPTRFPVQDFPAALDWHELERHPRYGPFRWSGPNPNPRYFLSVRLADTFLLRIHVLALADPSLAGTLRLEVNDREVPFTRTRSPTGMHVLTTATMAGSVEDGLVIRPCLARCVRLPDGRRAGLALSAIEVVPQR